MSRDRPGAVRCAIYTRKSSDEGLEQSFNSLDAQREACAAYILSQASEGWTALPEVYDDGGLSGGTLERPALKRLLAEVAAGRIDIIVVYKVDRLTRSLFDFAKLVETFDKAGTSFVSVTQSFNTTTSMGRLTLNMLLSFAQFEREVTAERIRDKIAASKARGMWMGGTPPLGYRPDGRSLAIVEEHAALVRHLFERYLQLDNVRLLEAELRAEGVALPVRERSNGSGSYGGGHLTRGQIYKILANPVYIGRIQHGEKSYAGLHPAIVDHGTWEQVQTMLGDNRQGSRARVRAASPSLLAGRLVDEAGEPLVSSHASKGNTRYRYYVSRPQQDSGSQAIRVPALEIEAAVASHIAQAFDDPFALAGAAWLTLTAGNTAALAGRAEEIAARLRRRDRATVEALVGKVCLHPARLDIEIATAAIGQALQLTPAPDAPASITLPATVTLTRSGRAMRLVQDNGAAVQRLANPSLVRLLVRARRWWTILRQGELDISALGAAEGVKPAYITRVVRLAFLSPAVTDAILKGGVRAELSSTAITVPDAIPACWKAQGRAMLPAI